MADPEGNEFCLVSKRGEAGEMPSSATVQPDAERRRRRHRRGARCLVAGCLPGTAARRVPRPAEHRGPPAALEWAAGHSAATRPPRTHRRGPAGRCRWLRSLRRHRAGGAAGDLPAPDTWGRHFGFALHERVIGILTDAGCATAVLWVHPGNERARRFYEKAGWVDDGAELCPRRPVRSGRPASPRSACSGPGGGSGRGRSTRCRACGGCFPPRSGCSAGTRGRPSPDRSPPMSPPNLVATITSVAGATRALPSWVSDPPVAVHVRGVEHVIPCRSRQRPAQAPCRQASGRRSYCSRAPPWRPSGRTGRLGVRHVSHSPIFQAA